MAKAKYKDDSIRTTSISKPFRNVVIALTMIIISIIWIPIGMVRYSAVVARSSSAIGSQLKFERSDSTMTIKNIYTDRNEDVLVVRLGLDDNAKKNLPFKGSDYRVMIGSDSLKGLNEASILFGKMSTDGDMFLMLPKPSKTDVYTVFLINTRFVSATNKDNKRAVNSTAANGDLDLDIQKSITSTLSAYDIDKKKDKTKVTSVKSDDLDAVTFRLALKPGVDNDKYRPEKIDADLVKDDEFQFETFFNKVFKETAIEKMEKDFAAKAEAKKQLQVSIQENEDRLRINEFDSEALQAKKANKDNLDKLELELSELAGTLREYQDLKYDSTMFANLNTKAVVFDVDAYKKRKG